MMMRIASLALTLAVLTACERQPQEPPRTPPPATGDATPAGPAGEPGRADEPRQTGQPAREADRFPRAGTDEGSHRMTEEQRQAALRACEPLQGEDRELCEREVRQATAPNEARRDDRQ